ncbi:MAG: 8-oxo-dGTP diphosphatase [Candidatus Paceibacterota bacterium]|jgi:8-oxo-dGTP pyrophosphatase MutT (NUDIX family)
MEKLRDVTLVFLIEKDEGRIDKICLAMKKRGFGANRWNGVGGKVHDGETLDQTAKREANEEIGVDLKNLIKIAELSFYFPHNSDWNQMVHAYFCEDWEGDPVESEEMKPDWFSIPEIPYSEMWPADNFWLPEVINGNLLKAVIHFGEGDVVLDKKLDIIEKF